MTKEQLAANLHRREYPLELLREEVASARDPGLVIVYGSSDDLIEFEGAIHDEGVGYDTFTVKIGHEGIIPQFGVLDTAQKHGREIKAIWNRDNISWQYETDIPHATFEIMEDGEIYCRGIVFSIHDL